MPDFDTPGPDHTPPRLSWLQRVGRAAKETGKVAFFLTLGLPILAWAFAEEPFKAAYKKLRETVQWKKLTRHVKRAYRAAKKSKTAQLISYIHGKTLGKTPPWVGALPFAGLIYGFLIAGTAIKIPLLYYYGPNFLMHTGAGLMNMLPGVSVTAPVFHPPWIFSAIPGMATPKDTLWLLAELAVAGKIAKGPVALLYVLFPQMKQSIIYKTAKKHAKWVWDKFVLKPLVFGRQLAVRLKNVAERLGMNGAARQMSHLLMLGAKSTRKTMRPALRAAGRALVVWGLLQPSGTQPETSRERKCRQHAALEQYKRCLSLWPTGSH
jgi:hypothetical protein